MRKDLREIREELEQKAEKEAYKLYRLVWRAVRHGCTAETVAKIREEADWCHRTGTAYPDRLVSWDVEYNFKYAFKF